MADIATRVSSVANESHNHTRRVMPEQPWWDNLASRFHKFPGDAELYFLMDPTVSGTARSSDGPCKTVER